MTEITEGVLREVRDERVRQDFQWGGAEHDDTHHSRDWRTYRLNFETRVMHHTIRFPDPERVRDALVKIAALAVAQIESLDRAAREVRAVDASTERKDG